MIKVTYEIIRNGTNMLSSLDGLKGLQNIYKITNNSMLKTGIPDMLLLGMFRNINDTVKSNESE